MSEVLKSQADFGSPRLEAGAWSLRSYLPAALPGIGAFLMLFLRIQLGASHFIDDAARILILARFIGSELLNLQPVLDSYWRPIHVGIASLSYGIALVCFATAVVYLLMDGVKVESMAVWSSAFALVVIATVSKGSVLMFGTIFWGFDPSAFGSYGSGLHLPPHDPLPLRAEIPYVGWLLVAAAILLAGGVAPLFPYAVRGEGGARRLAHHVLKAALAAHLLAVALLAYEGKPEKQVAVCDGPRPAE